MQDHDPTTRLEHPPHPATWRRLSNKRTRWVIAAAAALACAVVGLSLGLTRNTAATTGTSNARSGPAEGGAAGTVTVLSASSFTMTTAAGQQVRVNEPASTTYQNGTSSTSADAVTPGETVVVLGMTDGTTITATTVIVQPTGDYGSAASTAAGVVRFQQGAPSASKQVGQIPASYTQGSGTIVSGVVVDQATKAALAAYPGGVVDRVVQLSDGQYEVHDIGVNWPHHIFVSQYFKVVGAN
jgi:hypothetical protein